MKTYESYNRIDFPMEYLYFKFDNWNDHVLFLKTNHKNWTKYLAQFDSFKSVDVILNNDKQELIRLIIWDSYKSWKSITPGDVAAIDKKHRLEFPFNYERKSQMYCSDKHPMMLVSREYGNVTFESYYSDKLNHQVLKFDLELVKSGSLEKFLMAERLVVESLKESNCFINRDIYSNKFNPKYIEGYYFLNGDEKYFDVVKKMISKINESNLVGEIKFSSWGELVRESIFINTRESNV